MQTEEGAGGRAGQQRAGEREGLSVKERFCVESRQRNVIQVGLSPD